MKKLLLLGAVVFGSLFTAQAQPGATCASAITITSTTTNPITASAFAGTGYQAYCLGSATDIKAKWYKYTATANGEVTISSNLTDNVPASGYTNDTRVSVLRGDSCTTLEQCIATSDDVSSTNFLTTLTFPVQSGETYYIQWDSYWQEGGTLGFKWTFNFNTVSCIRTTDLDVYLPSDYTTTSATLAWDNAVGNPSSYDIDWSTNLTAAAGTGTILNVVAGTTPYTLGDVTGIPAESNFRWYLRSNCGFTQSAWQGPYFGYLAKSGSFTHNFNTQADPEDGFIGDFSLFFPASTSTLLSYTDGSTGGSVYTFNSSTAASDEWAFTRAFSLTAGQVVSLKYKTRIYPATGTPAPMSLRVTAGTDQLAAAQTQVLQTINPTGNTAFTQNTTPNWTVPATGVYYFGFHNNSAANATSTAIFLDTIEVTVTGAAGTNDVLASAFAVFPNPAANMITVSGTDALVNGIELIDLNGRTVKTLKVNGLSETQVNISDLSAGVYMMNITSDKGVATKKIVKQ
jgi:hypothetical protein